MRRFCRNFSSLDNVRSCALRSSVIAGSGLLLAFIALAALGFAARSRVAAADGFDLAAGRAAAASDCDLRDAGGRFGFDCAASAAGTLSAVPRDADVADCSDNRFDSGLSKLVPVLA